MDTLQALFADCLKIDYANSESHGAQESPLSVPGWQVYLFYFNVTGPNCELSERQLQVRESRNSSPGLGKS